MKILTVALMMMVTTSVFAEPCVLNGKCTLEACKALNADYAIASGNCVDPKASEKETQCAGINGAAQKTIAAPAASTVPAKKAMQD